MSAAWAVVAAALGSATLTIAGTFWLEQWRLGQAGKAARDDRLREACVQMGAHALQFALRAQALYLTAVFRSGIGEGLDIVLYHRRPIDPMELADWLAVDFRPMLEAQSLIEVTAGEELVRAAADLILAATTVLERSSNATSTSAGPGASLRHRIANGFQTLVPLRRDPEVEGAIQEAVRELGRELHEFARVTRERLGVNHPDAVIRAFPELFAERLLTPPNLE
ncbi:MAG: hypothetical protein ACYDEP_07285 [Acidimicrobiales bacterium]|jgi:hypothetical protein